MNQIFRVALIVSSGVSQAAKPGSEVLKLLPQQ